LEEQSEDNFGWRGWQSGALRWDGREKIRDIRFLVHQFSFTNGFT
jgi:hypothetical protein